MRWRCVWSSCSAALHTLPTLFPTVTCPTDRRHDINVCRPGLATPTSSLMVWAAKRIVGPRQCLDWKWMGTTKLHSITFYCYIYIIYIHIHNYIMHIITNSILHFTYIYYYTEYMCYTRILPSTLESDGIQNSPSLARSVASPKSMNFCPVTPWWPLEWWAMLAPSLASTAKVLRSFGCRRRTTRASHTSRVPLWWVCLDNRLGTEPLG